MAKAHIGKMTHAKAEMQHVSGKGEGGGSKPTPQAAIGKRGSGRIPSSAPRNPHRLRG